MVTKAQIEDAARRWLKEMLDQDSVRRHDWRLVEDYAKQDGITSREALERSNATAEIDAEEWRRKLRTGDFEDGLRHARSCLGRAGVPLTDDEPLLPYAAAVFTAANAEYHGRRADRLESDDPVPDLCFDDLEGLNDAPAPASSIGPSPGTTTVSTVAAVAAPAPAAISGPPVTLGNEVAAYLKEQEPHLARKRRMDFRSALDLLCRCFGNEKPVFEIDRRAYAGVVDLLKRMPVHADKIYPGLVPGEQALRGEEEGRRRLSPGTINAKYVALHAKFFERCVARGEMTDNPASAMRHLGGAPGSEEKRRSFTPEELKRLFSAPVFTGCQSAGRTSEKGDFRVNDHRFWVPVLGLYTGARLNELCQLLVDDVKQEGTIWFIDICRGPGKNLKSEAAERKVPLRRELIELGFLDYQRSRKAAGSGVLFPELKVGAGGYKSDNASKWFARLLKSTFTGPTERDGLVFHSFRHHFVDRIRNVSGEMTFSAGAAVVPIEERLADALVGHSSGHVSAGYGLGYSVATLKAAIDRLVFPELGLISPVDGAGKSEEPS
ncbi:MAG: site-specific integrase [Pseudomonadota bacterium]|nr:site-specific integrase [Pseudomonadota bacterium]